MLDLLIIFVPYLPPTQSTSLFNATATPAMLEHPDATVQKKSYRLLKRLLEGGKLDVKGDELEVFVGKLNDVGGGVGPGAQRVSLVFCLNLLSRLSAIDGLLHSLLTTPRLLATLRVGV
jgi:ribosomal RNA-processing protein 12